MKNYVGLAVLAAFVAGAYFVFGSLGLDIHIHDHFVVVPVTVFLFWLSMGIAGVWLLFRVIRRTIAAKRVG
jgi:hypothetical protein